MPRRLQAEAVYDAVIAATAGGAELTKRADDPVANCAIGLSKGYTTRGMGGTYALNVFGKPKRETRAIANASNEPSLLQTVYLRNEGELFPHARTQQRLLAELNKAVASWRAGQEDRPEETGRSNRRTGEGVSKATRKGRKR